MRSSTTAFHVSLLNSLLLSCQDSYPQGTQPPSWKTAMGSKKKTQKQFRRKQLATCHSTWTLTNLQGHMGFNQGYWRSRKVLAKVFTSFASYPGQPWRSQMTGDLPMSHPYKKNSQYEEPGNCTAVSLITVSGRVMKQVVFSAITQRVQDNRGVRPGQHGFIKSRSSFITTISFYNLFDPQGGWRKGCGCGLPRH